jgi:O-antigen/teichoic acid export membrane protein
MAAVLILCRHPLLRMVSGGAFAQQSGLLYPLLVLGFLILSVCVVPYCLVLGLGGSRPVSLITSGSMIGSVVVMAFLTPALGVEGAALARLVYGFGVLTLFIQARRRLGAG